VTEQFDSSRRHRPPQRRPSPARWIVVVLAALVIFGLGAALGAALESNPSSGGSSTFVRTYPPLSPAPAPKTVTVTATP
jgi:hypothetical protein